MSDITPCGPGHLSCVFACVWVFGDFGPRRRISRVSFVMCDVKSTPILSVLADTGHQLAAPCGIQKLLDTGIPISKSVVLMMLLNNDRLVLIIVTCDNGLQSMIACSSLKVQSPIFIP